MAGSETSHLTKQRISEIVSGAAPTACESMHLANCRECLLPIEKEGLLRKAIADFRRRHEDREPQDRPGAEY